MNTAKQVDPAAKAALFILQDQVHEPMHDRFLWATMQRRNAEAAALPEWEELREIASKIKEHTLTHLDRYLEEFEANATKRGAQVHWAKDAAEHNEIVYFILQDHGVRDLIKSKSGFGRTNPTARWSTAQPYCVPRHPQNTARCG